MANNVDPDQTPHNAASDLGLHCLHEATGISINMVIVKTKQTSLLLEMDQSKGSAQHKWVKG